jgi:hypothetical protein
MSSPVKVVNQKGERGGKYLAAAGSFTADIDVIFAHVDSVVNAVSTNIEGTLTAVSVPKGSFWVGRFTSVTWVSGEITVYVKA